MTDRIEQLNRDEAFEAWWDNDGMREKCFPESKGIARAAWHAALAAAPEGEAREAIIEQCARACEKLAERRFDEHGTREPDTNATYYGGSQAAEFDTRDDEDEDCAAAVRALKGHTMNSGPERKP